VSSFLLNEKRGRSEARGALKVNISWGPNPHLETPHYKVQRLKPRRAEREEHVRRATS